MKRRKSRKPSRRRHTVKYRRNAYNGRRRKSAKRTRRNKGGSAWLRHAASYLRQGKTLKQASASYRKRR